MTPFSWKNVISSHFKRIDIKLWIPNQYEAIFFLIIFIPKQWTSVVKNVRTKSRSNSKRSRYILGVEAFIFLYFLNMHDCIFNQQNTKVPEFYYQSVKNFQICLSRNKLFMAENCFERKQNYLKIKFEIYVYF